MRYLGIIFTILTGLATVAPAQEYDDLYFNGNDREKLKKEPKKARQQDFQQPYVQPVTDQNGENYHNENYSTNTVNPAKVEEYERKAELTRLQYQSEFNSSNVSNNSNFGEEQRNFQYSSSVPYADDYQDQGNTIINNNYYGAGWNNGWNNGWGINSWWGPGWGAGWSVNVGWGWGNNWWCDPFWDPWCYNTPLWGGGIGWNWGWNSWGWGWNRPWRRGFYNPYWGFYDYGGIYIVENTPTKQAGRTRTRGARSDRGGRVISNRTSENSRELTNRSVNGRDGRNYSDAQRNYYSRSRGNISSRNSNTRGRVNTDNNSSRRFYQGNSQNSNRSSNRTYSGNSGRSQNRNYSSGRSGDNNNQDNVSRRSSNSRNRNYSRSNNSSSRSRSYNSSKSKSRSRSYNRSSSRSRSNSRSSSASRSSGSRGRSSSAGRSSSGGGRSRGGSGRSGGGRGGG